MSSSKTTIVSTTSNNNEPNTVLKVLILQLLRVFIKSIGECMFKLHDGIEIIEKHLLSNNQLNKNSKELIDNDSYYDTLKNLTLSNNENATNAVTKIPVTSSHHLYITPSQSKDINDNDVLPKTNDVKLHTGTQSVSTTLDDDNTLVDQLMNTNKKHIAATDGGESSCGGKNPPIAAIQQKSVVAVAKTSKSKKATNDEVSTDYSKFNVSSSNISLDDPKMMLDYPDIYPSDDVDFANLNTIDLWDDAIEPEISAVAKILNRDLWLSNVKENDVCDLLERLIKIKTSRSDFVSYGGLTVLVIIMNKFKTNESIICKCCKLMAALLAKADHDPIVARISEDTRWIRCIVQCMNQYPNNIDIQRYCFCLLYVITLDKIIGANLVMEVFQKKNGNFNDALSGLQSVLAGMKAFSTTDYMQSVGCHILQNIAYKEHRLMIRQHGAINVLKNALENHKITSAKSTIQRLLSND